MQYLNSSLDGLAHQEKRSLKEIFADDVRAYHRTLTVFVLDLPEDLMLVSERLLPFEQFQFAPAAGRQATSFRLS